MTVSPEVSTDRVGLTVMLCALLAACASSPERVPGPEAPRTENSVPKVEPSIAVTPPSGPVAAPVKPSLTRMEGPDASTKPPFGWRTLADAIGADPAKSLVAHIPPEINTLEAANPQLLDRLLNQWQGTQTGRFTVLHFGDSHVQGGFGAQITRHKLQAMAGSAGRGMVFPYSIAKTYSQNDYKSTFEGEWSTANSIQVFPKMPLGVSGFVARTSNVQAAFTLQFNQQFEPGGKILKIMYRASSPGYLIRIQSGQWQYEAAAQAADSSPGGTQVLEMSLPQLHDSIRFEMFNADPKADDWFEFFGLSIENPSPGVIYHNLGVGGAAYGALQTQAYFESQSSVLSPDLVILDWGTNDLIYKNTVPESLQSTIVSTIRKVRAAHPQALIMLTTVQDTFFRRRPVTATAEFAQLVRRIAQENDCLLYDWYRVAGGRDAMRTWYAYGLALPDHVHLSGSGYAIKGELLALAMLNAMAWRQHNPEAASLWRDPMSKGQSTVSDWLKTQHPFQRRPDLIRVSASGKEASGTSKTPARKGAKNPVKHPPPPKPVVR